MNDQQHSRADALTDAAALAMYEKASIAASEFDSVEAAHVAFVRSILAASPVARPAAAPSDNAHLLVALDMHRAEQKVPLSDVSPTSLDDLYSKAEPDSEILKLVEQYGCALLKQRTDEATAILEQIRTLATSANETGAEGANSRPIYVSADNLRLYEAGLYSMFDVGVETPDRTIRLYTAPPAMAAAAPADERDKR
ncbi:hypothetical protein LGN11_26280 [Burkholderia multivorans]|nr:hypothetical protein [Burkholderia multivorans]